MSIDTRVVIPGGQFSQNSEDDKSGACACLGVTSLVIFILALCAWAMYIFVGSIIMLADGGAMDWWRTVPTPCEIPSGIYCHNVGVRWDWWEDDDQCRDSYHWWGYPRLDLRILASVLSWTEANRSDTCTVYMDDTYGVTSPYVVLINQIVFGWFMTFMELIGCFFGAMQGLNRFSLVL